MVNFRENPRNGWWLGGTPILGNHHIPIINHYIPMINHFISIDSITINGNIVEFHYNWWKIPPFTIINHYISQWFKGSSHFLSSQRISPFFRPRHCCVASVSSFASACSTALRSSSSLGFGTAEKRRPNSRLGRATVTGDTLEGTHVYIAFLCIYVCGYT